MRALLLLLVVSGCAVAHDAQHGASCEDAKQRLYDMSCIEGYASNFCALAGDVDFDCVLETNTCTEAREACYGR